MKNIHLLPTDKPSRLRYNLSNILVLTKEAYRDYRKQVNQNIYITSDEEIKEGDWVIDNDYDKPLVYKADRLFFEIGKEAKKIILTTDQDLIKDGVQAIPDEFLEWFVKNPNCEEVKIDDLTDYNYEPNYKFYGIIIPKEEPKQETLEEVNFKVLGTKTDTFYNGAKWQQEQCKKDLDAHLDVAEHLWLQVAKQNKKLYSEEDIIDLIQFLSMNKEFNEYSSVSKETARYFLEQFKKK